MEGRINFTCLWTTGRLDPDWWGIHTSSPDRRIARRWLETLRGSVRSCPRIVRFGETGAVQRSKFERGEGSTSGFRDNVPGRRHGNRRRRGIVGFSSQQQDRWPRMRHVQCIENTELARPAATGDRRFTLRRVGADSAHHVTPTWCRGSTMKRQMAEEASPDDDLHSSFASTWVTAVRQAHAACIPPLVPPFPASLTGSISSERRANQMSGWGGSRRLSPRHRPRKLGAGRWKIRLRPPAWHAVASRHLPRRSRSAACSRQAPSQSAPRGILSWKPLILAKSGSIPSRHPKMSLGCH